MRVFGPLLVCLSLLSSSALANPIMVVVRLSAEVTGTTHVRVRYLTNYGSSNLQNMATYGTSHSDWFTTGDQTSEDTGSGRQTMTYRYMCDCHVPTGSPLTYQIALPSGIPAYTGTQLTATVTPSPRASTLCDDQCALADSCDGGASQRDAGAEPVPDAPFAVDAEPITPAGTGGAVATGGVTATGGSQGSGGAPATGGSTSAAGDTSPSNGKQDGGGCSFAPLSPAGTLSLLFALGLVALARRRKR
jgi:hypothetical protein